MQSLGAFTGGRRGPPSAVRCSKFRRSDIADCAIRLDLKGATVVFNKNRLGGHVCHPRSSAELGELEGVPHAILQVALTHTMPYVVHRIHCPVTVTRLPARHRHVISVTFWVTLVGERDMVHPAPWTMSSEACRTSSPMDVSLSAYVLLAHSLHLPVRILWGGSACLNTGAEVQSATWAENLRLPPPRARCATSTAKYRHQDSFVGFPLFVKVQSPAPSQCLPPGNIQQPFVYI